MKAMSTDTPPNMRLAVLYDPLCGWCYGATPSIRRLAREPGVSVELAPTGLFAGAGARPMDMHFAEYAWSNDQRIERLTGQSFSERYRERVLGDRATPFDSGPATLALTAASQSASEHELGALEAIQAARYVEGRDVTAYSVLADILRGLGLEAAAARVAKPTPELFDAVMARTAAARSLLRVLGSRGVPTLVVGGGSARRVVPSDLLYGRFDDLLHHIHCP